MHKNIVWDLSGLLGGILLCDNVHAIFFVPNTRMPFPSGWNIVDEKLADFFGLNESKYQWAVDEYYYQKQLVRTHHT